MNSYFLVVKVDHQRGGSKTYFMIQNVMIIKLLKCFLYFLFVNAKNTLNSMMGLIVKLKYIYWDNTIHFYYRLVFLHR